MRNALLASMTAAALLAAACTQTGNVERGAATGAVLGGVAGAVIGNNVGDGDAESGAAIGAAIGAIGGAYAGCVRDGGCGAGQDPLLFPRSAIGALFLRERRTLPLSQVPT
jgi:hypothetical protein